MGIPLISVFNRHYATNFMPAEGSKRFCSLAFRRHKKLRAKSTKSCSTVAPAIRVLPMQHHRNTASIMKQVTFKLPEPLATWLSRRARALGRTQADVICEALTQASQGGGDRSCHDALKDVCGIVDGPRDLSTSQKRLAGFGE